MKKLMAALLCCVGLASAATALTEDDLFSPDGYTFLQYLESDGTAYIDTGVTMTSADGVELSCMAIETLASGSKGIFGCRGASAGETNISIAYGKANSKETFILDFNNGTYTAFRLLSNTLNLDSVTYLSNYSASRGFSTNATNTWTKSGSSQAWTGAGFACPGTARIFDISGVAWDKAKIRLGYCRIFKAGELHRSYVPARRNSDGVLGLYDTVGKTFLVNAAEGGAFIAGPASRYRLVEWIASDGTQYVDTGFKMTSGDSFSIKFMPMNLGDKYYGIFGARESAAINNISAFYAINHADSDYNNSSTESSRATFSGATGGNVFEVFSGEGLRQIVSGGTTRESTTHVEDVFECQRNATIFMVNGETSTSWLKATARLYSCDVFRNDEATRSYIPVVRTWDGVGEAFDTVGGVAYGTASMVAQLAASEKDWVTVGSDTVVEGSFLPSGLGRNSGLVVGSETTFSCPASIENASHEEIGQCTGWQFTYADGTVAEGSGASVTLTLTNNVLYGRLTWKYKSLASCRFRSELTVAVDAMSFDPGEEAPEDIPVLVRISETRIDGFFYSDCNSSGRDIFFATDGVGANVIPHEVDTWNTSGESLVWVKIPLAEAGSKIFMFWGGDSSHVDPTGVWSAYAAVWHFNSGLADATRRGHDAVGNSGSAVSAGKIGQCWGNGSLSAPSFFDSVSDATKLTISGWFNVGDDDTRRMISTKTTAADNGVDLVHYAGGPALMLRGSGLSATVQIRPVTVITNGNWKHYAGVCNGTSGTLYINMDNDSKASGTIDAVVASDNEVGIGGYGGDNPDIAGTVVNGCFDECRVYNGVASSAWLKVEYASVANASFFTCGAAFPCGQGKTNVGLVIVVR